MSRIQDRARAGAARSTLRTAMFFGKNMSATRCTAALVEALRDHGLQVARYNLATLRRWLGIRQAEAWVRRGWRHVRPDLVFVFGQDLPRPLLEEFRRGSVTVLWEEESLEGIDGSVVDYFGLADLVCASNPGRFPWLAAQGLDNMAFLMSGFSPTFHRPVRPRPARREVAFIGTPGRCGRRVGFLQEISRRFHTEIFGQGWRPYTRGRSTLRVRRPVGSRAYARICASSKVVLGLNEINRDRLYFSNRTWLTLACAGFHVTHYVPGLEEVFEQGGHLVWYRDLDDAVERIGHYLERGSERRRIAAAGCRLVRARHRYHDRVGEILKLLQAGARRPRRSDPVRGGAVGSG